MPKAITTFCLLFLAALLYTTPVHAHGLNYSTEPLGDMKIRIRLQWSKQEVPQGFVIRYFYLSNGKTLHIGYERKKGAATTALLDYDLTGALPPLRIVLEAAGGGSPFRDTANLEAEEYIRHLHDAGLVNGSNDGNFYPNRFITRAEFVKILVGALGLSDMQGTEPVFKDVKNHWAKKEISIAAARGLVSGNGDNTFRPDNNITVAEAGKILITAFTFRTQNNGIYSKLVPGKWYSPYIKKVFDAGLLRTTDSIYEDFREEAFLPRADCAMMISRAITTY